jgi:hypothetical protein
MTEDDDLKQKLIMALRSVIVIARNPPPSVIGANRQTPPPELQQLRDAAAVLMEAEARWPPSSPS